MMHCKTNVVVERLAEEIALAEVCAEFVFVHALEYAAEVRDMSVECVREDAEIVDESCNKVIQHVVKSGVDHGLKGGRSVAKTTRHDKPFKGAILGAKDCLVLVSFNRKTLNKVS